MYSLWHRIILGSISQTQTQNKCTPCGYPYMYHVEHRVSIYKLSCAAGWNKRIFASHYHVDQGNAAAVTARLSCDNLKLAVLFSVRIVLHCAAQLIAYIIRQCGTFKFHPSSVCVLLLWFFIRSFARLANLNSKCWHQRLICRYFSVRAHVQNSIRFLKAAASKFAVS